MALFTIDDLNKISHNLHAEKGNNDKNNFIRSLANDIATSHKKPIEIIKSTLANNKIARVYFRKYGIDEFLPIINNNIAVNQDKITSQELMKIIDNPVAKISINEKSTPNLSWYKKYEKELIDQGFEAEFNIAGSNLITIEIIGVPKEMHGKGYGSIIMKNLINYADANGIVLQLRPAASSTHSRAKLINFYKKFGFIENKGKSSNDNYQYMYRLPKNEMVGNLVEKILKESIDNISAFIKKLSKDYIKSGDADNIQQINNGYCADVANIVNSNFSNSEILSDHNFIWDGKFTLEPNDKMIPEKYGRFFVDKNNQLICEKYNSKPHIPYKNIKELGIHTWIFYNGKHYDVECPNGVTNFFDLPIFNR